MHDKHNTTLYNLDSLSILVTLANHHSKLRSLCRIEDNNMILDDNGSLWLEDEKVLDQSLIDIQ